MKPKYKLIVKEGSYAEDSLLMLLLRMLQHRLHHLRTGGGWRD